ncbi:MAG: glycine--tRNA ligase subunit beta [Gaiellaceae bacterium]
MSGRRTSGGCERSRASSRRRTWSRSRASARGSARLPSLLVEIGCEELPAAAVYEAETQLPDLVHTLVGIEPSELFVGPRRLAFLVRELPALTPEEWVAGPPLRAGEKAAEGFARRHGVETRELEERDGVLGVVKPPRPILEMLQTSLPSLETKLSFTKSMVWGQERERFARPIRWRVALLDDEPVPGDFGRETQGHRWTSPGPVNVPHAERYAEVLREAGVEPAAGERRRLIVEGLDDIGGWSDPAGVLDEVVHLVEQPLVVEASFAERYLELPDRVAVTAMQSHQRYFPLGGSRFAVVANGGDPDVVRAGHATVLESRLEDATFTFERDVAVGIEGLAARLGSIVFVRGAGTFAGKSDRLVRLVDALGGGDASREAARLAKADQAAELVREFPELQGYIGGEYARLAGFPEGVTAAIEEHYLPDASGGPLPSTEPGKTLAAADKVDTLTVAFALGQRPTGSRDPYGLRRAAIGLCRLALEADLRLEVRQLVAVSHKLLVEQGADLEQGFEPAEVAEFVAERLEGLLDVSVEFVRAARRSAVTELGAVARLGLALEALDREQLEVLHTAYTRAERLAGKAEGVAAAVDRSLLSDEAEKAVVETLERVEAEISARLAAGHFAEALAAGGELGAPLARFFDEVLVMADDSAVRANRLRLLLDVRDTLGALGDFSQLPL